MNVLKIAQLAAITAIAAASLTACKPRDEGATTGSSGTATPSQSGTANSSGTGSMGSPDMAASGGASGTRP